MTIKRRGKDKICSSAFQLENHDYFFAFNGKHGMPLITDKQEAREYEITLKRQLRAGTFVADSPVQNFARFWTEMFMADSRNRKAKLSTEFDKYYGERILAEFGRYRLTQITPGMIERFLLKLSRTKTKYKRNYAPVTVRMYFDRINQVFNHARRERIFFGDNPCRLVNQETLKQFPRWQPRERWLNQYDEDEETRLFEELDSRLQVICRLLLLTGMRPPQEILHVEKEHVNLSDKAKRYKLDDKTWMIPPRAVFIVKGKDGTRRMVPLNEQAQRILTVLCDDATTGQWLFTNREGSRLASIKKGWQAACERAGIEDLRPYDLRHSFATRLVERNVHPFVISALLGHSMPVSGFGQASRITPGYAHATWDAMQWAVDSLSFDPVSLEFSSKSDKSRTNGSENEGSERKIQAG